MSSSTVKTSEANYSSHETLSQKTPLLGDRDMDHSHREFLALAQHVASSTTDQLAPAMQSLFEHTREHFTDEEQRMQSVNHRMLSEHRADHQRILGDMERLCQRAQKGRGAMARAWVSDNLLDWFANHTRTMDRALAADLSPRDASRKTD